MRSRRGSSWDTQPEASAPSNSNDDNDWTFWGRRRPDQNGWGARYNGGSEHGSSGMGLRGSCGSDRCHLIRVMPAQGERSLSPHRLPGH